MEDAELAHLALLLTVLFVSPALGPPFPPLQTLSTDPESGQQSRAALLSLGRHCWTPVLFFPAEPRL